MKLISSEITFDNKSSFFYFAVNKIVPDVYDMCENRNCHNVKSIRIIQCRNWSKSRYVIDKKPYFVEMKYYIQNNNILVSEVFQTQLLSRLNLLLILGVLLDDGWHVYF